MIALYRVVSHIITLRNKMKIGILSDTHNNLSNLLFVLSKFRSRDITTVIHCGDLGDMGLIQYFDGFRLIYTYGNWDRSRGLINFEVQKLGNDLFAGPFFDGKIAGKKIMVLHGEVEEQVLVAVHLRQYDYIIRGHTHEHSDKQYFQTRIINPGALGGVYPEPRSFCTLDLVSNDLQFFVVPER